MITMSCRIAGGDYDCRGVTTRMLKVHLTRIGVEAQALRRAMIAAYEAEMNVVIHARTGSMWARFDDGRLDTSKSPTRGRGSATTRPPLIGWLPGPWRPMGPSSSYRRAS